MATTTFIQKNMTPEMRKYFDHLQLVLGLKFYFYGSIHRYDYFHHESDIDIDIFAQNIDSTLFQMKQYLHIPNKKVKKVMTYLDKNVIQGYKFSYTDKKLQLKCEYSIYPSKYKSLILSEHLKKTNLPILGILCLLIIKTIYYNLKLMDMQTYKKTKRVILSSVVGYKDPPFVVFNTFYPKL